VAALVEPIERLDLLVVGRAVAAPAADPEVAARAAQALTSWDLAEEYDVDGTRPHCGRYFAKMAPGS
jgi:hypothetical protein